MREVGQGKEEKDGRREGQVSCQAFIPRAGGVARRENALRRGASLVSYSGYDEMRPLMMLKSRSGSLLTLMSMLRRTCWLSGSMSRSSVSWSVGIF